jgi:hypothetical protein
MNTSSLKLPAVLAALVLATLAVALYNLSTRASVESRNQAVGLALEYELVADYASASRLDVGDALQQLQQAGLVGVTLSEDRVLDLEEAGKLQVLAGPEGSVQLVGDQKAIDRVQPYLAARFSVERHPEEGDRLLVQAPLNTVRLASIGLSNEAIRAASEADLEVIARFANPSVAPAGYPTLLLNRAAEEGVDYYLPQGDQVLGASDLLEETVEALERTGMYYASAEFVKIGGDAQVSRALPEQFIRLHSIQGAEAEQMSEAAVAERFVKAFRERKMRWLLLRPTTRSAENPVGALTALVQSIGADLESSGATLKAPHGFAAPEPPTWTYWATSAFGLATLGWLLAQFLATPTYQWLVVGAGLIAGLGLGVLGSDTLASLATAVAFPTAAMMMLLRRPVAPVWGLPMASLVSLAGGLGAAAVLNDHLHLLKIEAFTGVKVAHFAPVLLVALIALFARIDFKTWIREPIRWGVALGLIVIASALGYMLVRTGNESAGAVSGLEVQFRALLEETLYTRPRTKEFLIGHPALWLGLALLIYTRKNQGLPWLEAVAAALLVLGTIGQTSMVNTLLHLHTPLTLSLARIAIGLVIGGIVGAVAWAVLKPLLARLRSKA